MVNKEQNPTYFKCFNPESGLRAVTFRLKQFAYILKKKLEEVTIIFNVSRKKSKYIYKYYYFFVSSGNLISC